MSDLSRILHEPPTATFSPVKWQFEPCGDRCVILVLGRVFSVDLNRQAAAIGSQLRALGAQGQLPGVTDVVSAMVTIGVHYSPESIVSLFPGVSPYESICKVVTKRLDGSHSTAATIGTRLDIPVCYDPEYAPDLKDIAQACGVTVNEVIAAHTADWLDVLMVGFAPGHPYIGMHDSALSLPRRATPRTLVRQGSIGVANRQSVIYPADLPGGWNLIGRTPVPMFSPLREPPCLLQGGDQIRFVAITRHEFDLLAREKAK